MAVTLTEKAAAEVKRVIEEQSVETDTYLRIGIAGGGCSGFMYTLNFDTSYDAAKDRKFDCHGVQVVVDKRMSLHMDGTTVDWYEAVGRRGFTFDNPNALRTCSCGH